MSEIKYEVVDKIGVLSTSAKNWTTELRVVKWNDWDPKYDIRSWSPYGSKMGKGITLTKDEMKALGALITQLLEDGKLD